MHLQKKLKEGKRFYMGDLLKGIATAAAAAVLAFSMTACSQQTLIPETETSAEETVSEAETQELFQAEMESAGAEAAGPEAADLKDVAGLVGMNDEATADLLGGGEENWTEDSSFSSDGRIMSSCLMCRARYLPPAARIIRWNPCLSGSSAASAR